MTTKTESSSGIGFFDLLTIVFIALRLTDNIDWSWWWVLSPLWLPLSALIGVVVIIFLIGYILDR